MTVVLIVAAVVWVFGAVLAVALCRAAAIGDSQMLRADCSPEPSSWADHERAFGMAMRCPMDDKR